MQMPFEMLDDLPLRLGDEAETRSIARGACERADGE